MKRFCFVSQYFFEGTGCFKVASSIVYESDGSSEAMPRSNYRSLMKSKMALYKKSHGMCLNASRRLFYNGQCFFLNGRLRAAEADGS